MEILEPEWLEWFTVIAFDRSIHVQCNECGFSGEDLDCLNLLSFWTEAKSWAYIHLEECRK